MKAFNQIRNAIDLIKGYKAQEPLNSYLKNEFKKRPQFGSNDRRLMRELCICYFKIGHALPSEDYQKRLMIGYFLNNQASHPVFEHLATEFQREDLIALIDKDWKTKESAIAKMMHCADIYPFRSAIDESIRLDQFYENFFTKPTTWLRVRVKAKERFEEFLHTKKISFTIHANCHVAYGFAGMINISDWPTQIQSAVEVQDISSQLSLFDLELMEGEKVWDCCAGSGGKSLLLHSIQPKIELYVSDVRPSIIKNLVDRFSQAGIGSCMKSVADLTKPLHEIAFENNKERKKARPNYFDTILVDAPCSGSGTWRRNPERLLFITKDEIAQYQAQQKEIVKNAMYFLKPGGTLIYLTCSLYKDENSAVTEFVEAHNHLTLEKSTYFNKINEGGDIIFRSLFKKAK